MTTPERARVLRAHRRGERGGGTVAWAEHAEAWEVYAKRYGREQSAERINERGGFGYNEIAMLLGHEPTTWDGGAP